MATTFDFTRNTGPIKTSNGKGYRMFVTIPEDVMTSRLLAEGSIMTMKFYDKSGKEIFSGKISIISKRRISFNKLTEDFIKYFGMEKTMFGYAVNGTGEWIVKEL